MSYLKASSEQEAKSIAKKVVSREPINKSLDFYVVYIEKTGLAANRRTSITGYWKIRFEKSFKNDFVGSGKNMVFVEDFE